MTRYAADAAWAPYPSPNELKTNGFEGFVRYLATPSSSTRGKLWTPEEIDACHAAGLWVLPVWEEQADRPLRGKAIGSQDCQDAESMWDALGAPQDSAVAYAYDFDPDPGSVVNYAEGVREMARHPVMAYCSDAVAVELFKRDLIDFFWQTESTGFRGRWPSPIAHMVQHVGYQRHKMTGDYDENVVVKDFAWWGPKPKGGLFVSLTPEEEKEVLTRLRNIDAVVENEVKRVAGSLTLYQAVTEIGTDGKAHARLTTLQQMIQKLIDKAGA